MAKIIWSDKATLAKEKVLEYGYREFGEYSVRKMYRQMVKIQDLLELFPLSGKHEPLLDEFEMDYRSMVFHAHYKLVYYFNEQTDEVRILDIWDTRRAPQNLRQGFQA